MKQTKKIALSACISALGVAVMALGALIETVDLTVAAVSSLLMVFVYLEIGSPYTWLTWLCTSLCTVLIFPAKPVGLEYFLIFGIYPLLKAYIERLPRPLWLPVKIVYLDGMFLLIMQLCVWLFQTPLFENDADWYKIALFAVATVAFAAYDAFISVMARIYLGRFRDRIKKYLK